MSWGVSAIGKPGPVADKIAADLAACKCVDPEEGVKNAAACVIAEALAAQFPDSVVRVNASGHQNNIYSKEGKTTAIQNTLRIEVEPIYGFVE